MSRSLKNFTTIEELLKTISSRQIRLLFLLHQYDTEMGYDIETAWDHIKVKDKFINEWFLTMQTATRKG